MLVQRVVAPVSGAVSWTLVDEHFEPVGAAEADALRRLDAAGEPVSFAAVARAGGVSRAWLCCDDAVRAEIDRLRRPRPPVRARPAAEQASGESLRQQLEAARTLIAELRAENQQLRQAVARKRGEHRAGTTHDHA